MTMERIIETLKEMRQKAERRFIDNSLIKRNALIDSPIPDTEADLEDVVELNEAINVLENHSAQKPKMNDH